MNDSSPIRVFVCHAFAKHDDYLRVFEYLESRDNFAYRNVSVTEPAPPGGKEGMREELRMQIKAAEILVLPLSVFQTHRDLVMFQLECAAALGRPIVAVKAFGETLAMQKAVMDRAVDIVDWNARALVDAIRQHARHENTARWDVVEFKLD